MLKITNVETATVDDDVSSLAQGATIAFAGKIIGRGLHVLGQIILARVLGPAVFGLYAIGWTIVRIGSVIAPLGLNNGVIRFAGQYWPKDQRSIQNIVLQALQLAMSSGIVFGGMIFVGAPWIAKVVFHESELIPVFRWFALVFPLASGLRVGAAATRISERMQYSAFAEDLGQPGANLILIFIVMAFGWGLLGAVGAAVISFVIGLTLALFYTRYLFSLSLSKRTREIVPKRELLIFSIPTGLAGTFTMLIFWVDRLIIGHYLPSSEVGIYQAASQSAMLFAIILTGFNAIFTPMIARLYHAREHERLNELFKVSTKWGVYVSLPLFFVLALFPQDVMNVVFGSDYSAGALPMVILASAQLLNASTGAVGFLLIMTGRQNWWFSLSFFMFLANVILNIWLIPAMGLLGAAIATACSVSGLFLFGLGGVYLRLGYWPYDRRYLKGGIAVLVTVLVLLGFKWLNNSGALFNVVFAVLISLTIFFATLLVIRLDDEDKKFVKILIARIKTYS